MGDTRDVLLDETPKYCFSKIRRLFYLLGVWGLGVGVWGRTRSARDEPDGLSLAVCLAVSLSLPLYRCVSLSPALSHSIALFPSLSRSKASSSSDASSICFLRQAQNTARFWENRPGRRPKATYTKREGLCSEGGADGGPAEVCVCVCEREGERECVRERERECVCVCEYVCEREREGERERGREG